MISTPHEELIKKLRSYIDSDQELGKIIDYTKRRFEAAKDLTAHNWAHAYRDTLNAIVIGEAEGADMSIVLPAAVMHDIGFLYGATGGTHGAVGADKLAEYLSEAGIELAESKKTAIADCIRTHKGSMHDEHPESLEAKVVADADLLEKFGPFGVYQTIRTYGEFDYPISKILARNAEFQTLSLETETGKKLAEEGRRYVTEFFDKLAEANKPYGEYEL